MVVVNASASQWGLTVDLLAEDGSVQFTTDYTEDVRAEEVGRAPIEIDQREYTDQPTTSFGTQSGSDVDIRFDWAATRIVVPLQFVGSGS